MNADKLADALRAFPEDPNPFTYRRAYAKAKAVLAAHDAQPAQAAQPVALLHCAGSETRHGIGLSRGSMSEWDKLLADRRVLNDGVPVYLRQQPVGVPDAHDVAKQVREALDREACPDHWMVLAYEAVVSALADSQPSADAFDFERHLLRQREWSGRTFGPGARSQGCVDHIRKELREIEANPGDLEEWIDVAILALDGAWRSGAQPADIVAALVAKQTKNERRKWPDWRTADPNKAIEHDRSKDTAPQPSADAEGAWPATCEEMDAYWDAYSVHRSEGDGAAIRAGLAAYRALRAAKKLDAARAAEGDE